MFNFPFYPYYPRTMYRRYIPENRPYTQDKGAWDVQRQIHASDRKKSNAPTDVRYTTKNRNVNTPMNSKHIQDSKENLDNRNKKEDSSDDKVFEILGIKLHFDDILLICLIFFLYNEGVKDESLFIALILLLLS